MRLTARARYALRLVLELYRDGGDGGSVGLAHVSEATGICLTFLDQLVVSLEAHGVLRYTGGRKGGYALARPASEITLAQILSAAAGRVTVAACVDKPEICESSVSCASRTLWVLMQGRLDQALGEFTLADLTAADWNGGVLEELAGLGASPAGGSDVATSGCSPIPACARPPSGEETAS